MAKTSLETTTEALRMIGVVAVDESPTAAEHERAKQHLEAVFAELDDRIGIAAEWTIETIPDRLWPFMAAAVGGSVCTAYGKPELTGMRQYGISGVCADEFGNEVSQPTMAQFF